MSTRGGRAPAGKRGSGDFTLLGCESVRGQAQQALPLPWSAQERRDLEAIVATSIPALRKAVLAVTAAAARKREREGSAASAMGSIAHAAVHGGSEESRRAAFLSELRARLSASLPLVKDVEQRMPTLPPEVCMQATSEMIDSLGFNLRPVSKRSAPKAGRVQIEAVLQRTFNSSTELEAVFGPRWYLEYSAPRAALAGRARAGGLRRAGLCWGPPPAFFFFSPPPVGGRGKKKPPPPPGG